MAGAASSYRSYLFGKILLGALLCAPAIGLGAEPPAKEPAAKDAATLANVEVPKPPAVDSETKCLALAVYWEGRAEPREGQLAIAHTVLNRTKHGEFPDTICGVVAQKTESGKACQFSWWCDGRQDTPEDEAAWEKAVASARDARQDAAPDPTGGALFFHSTKVDPNWDGKRKRIGRIGDHIFYR
jgi:N-acetylmuramoyl-L-alanine amidase